MDNVKALLELALNRMERARAILTDDNPRPECNWGMLDTSDLRAALAGSAQAPVGAISSLLADAMEQAVANGANSVSMPDKYVEIAVWLNKQSVHPVSGLESVPRDDALTEAVSEYLDAQDALDNQEFSGPNAQPYSTLIRRRNRARSDLDTALASQAQAPTAVQPQPGGREPFLTARQLDDMAADVCSQMPRPGLYIMGVIELAGFARQVLAAHQENKHG